MDSKHDAAKDFIDVKYSRLTKLEKYKASYEIWENINRKMPEIEELKRILSYLIFFTQLKKATKSKEITSGLKWAEQRLREVYEQIYPDNIFTKI